MINDLAAIILAAGKGVRLNCKTINKVAFNIGNKPMVSYIVNTLKTAGIKKTVCVIGFASQSVKNVLRQSVEYGFQKRRLGTARAALCGLKKIDSSIKHVLVLNGDDSAFYSAELIKKMYEIQSKRRPAITILTVKLDNPYGLGRIIRDKKTGYVIRVVEEKNANEEEKQVKEINTACYIFNRDFLEKYLPKIKKNPISKEYYLTDLIELAVKNGFLIQALLWPDNKIFQGVNSPDQLKAAQKRFL